MKNLRFIVPLFAVALAGCIGPGRLPHSSSLPPIAEEYYACDKCGSLHGGIYGKGPLAYFATANAAECWHRWRQISQAEFQNLAAEHFPGEWEKTNSYLKRAAEKPRQSPPASAAD